MERLRRSLSGSGTTYLLLHLTILFSLLLSINSAISITLCVMNETISMNVSIVSSSPIGDSLVFSDSSKRTHSPVLSYRSSCKPGYKEAMEFLRKPYKNLRPLEQMLIVRRNVRLRKYFDGRSCFHVESIAFAFLDLLALASISRVTP